MIAPLGAPSRVRFASSHVTGDYSSGTLTVRITREFTQPGYSLEDEVFFEVPADFHSHNDSVAAALMTLVGGRFPAVRFNFPVSERCAGMLRRQYALESLEPVDRSLEPRQRGRHLGLLLSGGLDSMAVWQVLRRAIGDEFKVITGDYGGGFAFEAQGFQHFRRDVSCRTDFRQKHFGQDGRLIVSVPLLFADYADLGTITTGYHYLEHPKSIESLRDGRRPHFLEHDLVINAGGLDEAHITRSLNSVAFLILNMLAEPDLLEACWYASAPPGTFKRYRKGLLLRMFHQQQGRPVPRWLDDVPLPHRPGHLGASTNFTTLYLANRFGVESIVAEVADLDQHDLSFLADLRMTFMERYHTTLIQYFPEELRDPVLSVFHEAGVYPFDERDFEELDIVRRFFMDAMARHAESLAARAV